ncbi:MAG TPA: hypothetical protein VF677_05060, partial [Flavobacterium sp.]
VLRRKTIAECIRCLPVFLKLYRHTTVRVFLKNKDLLNSRDCSGILRFFAQIERKAGQKAMEIVTFVLLIIHWIKKL